MKLSDKGWHKVVVAQNLLDDPDLEQSDFEGAVILSVKEARQVQRAIALAMFVTNSISHEKELSALIDIVADRIEQAEKQ